MKKEITDREEKVENLKPVDQDRSHNCHLFVPSPTVIRDNIAIIVLLIADSGWGEGVTIYRE